VVTEYHPLIANSISADFSFFSYGKGRTPSFLSSSFRSRPLSLARGSGERCKLPQWGLGRSPSRQTISCILESKSAALVAAVFAHFPENKCNFLHKNKLDIVRRVQFLTGRRPMRSFCTGAFATIALWKSAPMAYLSCRVFCMWAYANFSRTVCYKMFK